MYIREGTIGVENSRRGLCNHEIGVDTHLRSPNGLTLDLVAPFWYPICTLTDAVCDKAGPYRQQPALGLIQIVLVQQPDADTKV